MSTATKTTAATVAPSTATSATNGNGHGEAPVRPTKKIAIVGFTTSRNQTPWDDPTVEKWICNNLWKFVPDKWDRLYDLHRHDDIIKDAEHAGYLARCTKPVYVFEPRPEWPTSVAFPRAEVTDVLGNYFTNSISWMVAHALMEGVTELAIYGVDMAQGTEYSAQRPSVEYHLGIAGGMGVKVHIPPESDLLHAGTLYGVEDDSWLHTRLRTREAELVAQMAALREQVNQGHLKLATLQGALETTLYFAAVATSPRGGRDGQDPAAITTEGTT